MNQRQMLLEEIKTAPDDVLKEVLDFYHFLKSKHESLDECLFASESSLKKDWSLDAEEKAWENLLREISLSFRSPFRI
jgi:hypothetical protein